MYRAAAVTLLLVVASSARAQVVYEPVQYQFSNGVTYYYGGNNPAMHRYIERVKCRDGYPNGISGNHYSSLRNTLGQTTDPVYVFSDCMPYSNAAVYGYNATDAANEAMSNMPLYYTKRDLIMSAVPSPDGNGLSVPAMGLPAGSSMLMRHNGVMSGPVTMPAEPKPRAIIIIPKQQGPKHAPSDDQVKKAVAAVN